MEDAELVTVLSDDECRDLLRSATFGRIAFSMAGRVELYPVNIVYSDNELLFKTAPGLKLAGAATVRELVFQVDDLADDFAWSIVARGEPRVLSTEAELERAASLGVRPLIATPKNEYVAIALTEITGRRYVIGEEPEPIIDTIA